jgi:hypothetical protein
VLYKIKDSGKIVNITMATKCESCIVLCQQAGANPDNLPPVMTCAWCGNQAENTVKHFYHHPKSFFQHHDFCKFSFTDLYLPGHRVCYLKYHDYIISWKDLRFYDSENRLQGINTYWKLKEGLPFCSTLKHPDQESDTDLTCGTCGITSKSTVVCNIFMPEDSHKAFCKKNKDCMQQYMRKYTKEKKKRNRQAITAAKRLAKSGIKK